MADDKKQTGEQGGKDGGEKDTATLETGSYSVRIFVKNDDPKAKRTEKKATEVTTRGTIVEVSDWIAKQIAKLPVDKAATITRVEIRLNAPTEVTLSL